MSRVRAVAAFMLAAFSVIGPATAQSLRVSPVTIELPAGAGSAVFTLETDSKEDVAVQARVFRWSQSGGEDKLDKTGDVVISPPVLKVHNGTPSTLRLVRVAKTPVSSEETYRVLIDQIPDRKKLQAGSVALQVRQSVPIFFAGIDAHPGPIAWKAVQRNNKLVLEAANAGQKRVRLTTLAVTDDKNCDLLKGGLSYVLNGQSKKWELQPDSAGQKPSSSKPKATSGRSMRPLMSARAARIAGSAALLLAFWRDGSALAKPDTTGAGIDAGSYPPALAAKDKLYPDGLRQEDLFLAVFINDYDTQKIAPFHRFRDGCLTIAEEDLNEFKLKIPDTARHPSGGLCLEKMPGVTYRYDAAAQTIRLKISDGARVPLEFDAQRQRPDPTSGQDLSAVVNYDLFASGGTQDYWANAYPQYQGVSGTVNAHLFSQYGVFEQSLRANSTATEFTPNLLRLDTHWFYENPETLVTYSAGDVISGSLNWTSSIRMGGVQIRRDFALRPDLVTTPMQQFSSSAAVPTTVDVYNNQARLLSQPIAGGPFNVNNIPLATGPGTMRIVLRDANGKETVSEYAYYNSAKLLAPGLFDYSMETGFARHFFGLHSLDYDGDPIASGSARYGATPRLTVEGHAEGGAGLANLGVGTDFGLWHYGVASLAVSGSEWNGTFGGQGYASFETALWGARLLLRTQRGLGDYQDLSSVTAPKCPARPRWMHGGRLCL